jgi:hypothetical protein
VQAVDPQSLEGLEGLRRPTWIAGGDADTVAPPATNAARLIPRAQLEMVLQEGQYAFLSTCTPTAVASGRVCALASPQEPAHRLAIEKAGELFARYLPRRSLGARRISKGAVQPLASSAVCSDQQGRMTNIEQFKPKYPVLYVYRGRTLPDRVPVWIWDYFIDADGGHHRGNKRREAVAAWVTQRI